MNRLRISQVVVLLSLSALCLPAVSAAPQSFDIKDGMGEEVKMQQGWFGTKKRMVKDRLGNGYASKKGLFGTTETEASVLGNSIKRKKGFFGTNDIEGSTIFGDKVSTKKGLFGRRTTTVDVSGSSAVLKSLFGSKPPTPRATVTDPSSFPPPDQSRFNSQQTY